MSPTPQKNCWHNPFISFPDDSAYTVVYVIKLNADIACTASYSLLCFLCCIFCQYLDCKHINQVPIFYYYSGKQNQP